MPAPMAPRSSATHNEIRRELERRRKAINVAKGRIVKKSSAAPPPSRLIPFARHRRDPELKLADAPKEGFAKKASLPYVPRVLIPTGAPGAERKKIAYMDLGEAPKRLTHPRRPEALIPFAVKVPMSTAPIPRAPAAATKLSTRTSHQQETTVAETKNIKKPSSAPIKTHSSLISLKKGMTVKMRTPAGTLPTGQRLVILNHAVVVSDVAEDGYVQVVYKGNPHYPPMRIALDQLKTLTPTK